MSTPYSTIIEAFLKWVEEDIDFFHYFNLSDEEAMKLAETRSRDFLNEAVGRLTLECEPQVDFNDCDDDGFCFELTSKEIYLISSLMYERYLDRDFSKIKLYNVNFSSADLNVFDPSNARKTFVTIYEKVEARNEKLIDDYKNRDRITGRLIGIDYSLSNI